MIKALAIGVAILATTAQTNNNRSVMINETTTATAPAAKSIYDFKVEGLDGNKRVEVGNRKSTQCSQTTSQSCLRWKLCRK